jgi:hypothetical protein
LLRDVAEESRAKAEFKIAGVECRIGHQRHGLRRCFTFQAGLNPRIAEGISGIKQQKVFFCLSLCLDAACPPGKPPDGTRVSPAGLNLPQGVAGKEQRQRVLRFRLAGSQRQQGDYGIEDMHCDFAAT